VVNKTPIAAGTNRQIGGHAPSVYLAGLQKTAQIDPARMNHILRSHLIDPAALRGDDFDRFFEARSRALLGRIEKAMGKPILASTLEGEADEPEVVEYEAEEAEVA
jgi:hypothetical protein